jgi:tetratricopeptide (TPR) repeat protein
LAAVYSDRLGNVELAQKALEGAKRARPDDTSVKGAAVELLVARDELDLAVEVLRKDLARDPHDRKSYELLYGVFLRQSKFDRALSTAQVLADFRPSTEEEARFLADYPPFALGQVPGSLVEEAWASHFHQPALVPYGAILVNPDVLSGIEGILPYLVGKRLAELRPELAARGFFPAVAELTSMLATAVRVGLGERGADASAQKLDRALVQVMTEEERAAVSQAVRVAQAEGGKLDVRRWSQAADISSMRVGLLLAQDVRMAKKAVTAEPQAPSDLTPREKLGELYLFATSELYADLRQAVGVNLADGGPASSALR